MNFFKRVRANALRRRIKAKFDESDEEKQLEEYLKATNADYLKELAINRKMRKAQEARRRIEEIRAERENISDNLEDDEDDEDDDGGIFGDEVTQAVLKPLIDKLAGNIQQKTGANLPPSPVEIAREQSNIKDIAMQKINSMTDEEILKSAKKFGL